MQAADINPLTLPSVSLGQRSQLPKTSGIYFCLDTDGQILPRLGQIPTSGSPLAGEIN